MLLNLLFINPISFILIAGSLIIVIAIHEFAHAWTADLLGDPTPRANGRLTLNPLAHLDLIGSLAILVAYIGWGKPVPIDPYNLQSPKRDTALISLAGPLSNLILAFLLAIFLKITPPIDFIQISLVIIIKISLNLGIFNLIPIPPLDGAKILFWFLPTKLALEWEELLNRHGLIILMLLIFPFFGRPPLVSTIITPITNFLLSLLQVI